MGLPRVVPEGGLEVCGKFFKEGTVLSVPSYTIHRDPEVWGPDVEEFRPERWCEQDKAMIQKTFNPFSFGPRYVAHTPLPYTIRMLISFFSGCVGKNLATMELFIIIATVFRRYEFVLEDPNQRVRLPLLFISTKGSNLNLLVPRPRRLPPKTLVYQSGHETSQYPHLTLSSFPEKTA